MNEIAAADPPVIAGVSARRIEEAGLNALQTQRQLFYDGWVLRVSPGNAKRARSVSAHFESYLPVVEKIAYCESVYERCGLPALFRITPFSRPHDLEAALLQRGYVAFDSTLVQTTRLEAPLNDSSVAEDAMVRSVDAAAFAEAAGVLRGSTPTQRAAHMERLANSPLHSQYVTVHAGGEVVGTAQVALEGSVAGIFDVITAHEAQGRGIASLAVAHLLAWGWQHGAAIAYLQVTATNAPALAVYRKFGFRTLYTYHYCARPHELE